MGAIIGMKLLWHFLRLRNHLNLEAWVQIPNGVDLRCERRSKRSILDHVFRILKNIEKGKSGPRCQNHEKFMNLKFYLLIKKINFCYTNFTEKCVFWDIAIFIQIPSMGKVAKVKSSQTRYFI